MSFSNTVPSIVLTRDPIVRGETRFSVTEGAVVDFFGVVRNTEKDRLINGIDYEAFESMAEKQLKLIAAEAQSEFSLGDIAIYHRIGWVPAGEASLYVRVTAQHRGAALRACGEVIERLKAAVPIWKHPVFADLRTTKPPT
jgi:molybdopterin synthase catalytic subunit